MSFSAPDFAGFMQGWGWIAFSLVSAGFSAGIYLVNQYLRQPGYLLVFWMRVLIVIFLTPVMRWFPMPDDPAFYLAVMLTVFAATYADIRTFDASAKFGAGVVSRVSPATVWIAFFLWFLFDPRLLTAYAARPFNTAGVLLALFGCVYFAMRLHRCAVTRAALLYMLPALLCYALSTVLNKYAMGRGRLESVVYGYMYFQSILAVLVMGAYALWRQKEAPREGGWAGKRMLAAALVACFTWLCSMIYKNYAMAFTPNPSYLAALGLTAPVFIALFYRLAGHREEADVASGMGIVASAVLLALMTVR